MNVLPYLTNSSHLDKTTQLQFHKQHLSFEGGQPSFLGRKVRQIFTTQQQRTTSFVMALKLITSETGKNAYLNCSALANIRVLEKSPILTLGQAQNIHELCKTQREEDFQEAQKAKQQILTILGKNSADQHVDAPAFDPRQNLQDLFSLICKKCPLEADNLFANLERQNNIIQEIEQSDLHKITKELVAQIRAEQIQAMGLEAYANTLQAVFEGNTNASYQSKAKKNKTDQIFITDASGSIVDFYCATASNLFSDSMKKEEKTRCSLVLRAAINFQLITSLIEKVAATTYKPYSFQRHDTSYHWSFHYDNKHEKLSLTCNYKTFLFLCEDDANNRYFLDSTSVEKICIGVVFPFSTHRLQVSSLSYKISFARALGIRLPKSLSFEDRIIAELSKYNISKKSFASVPSIINTVKNIKALFSPLDIFATDKTREMTELCLIINHLKLSKEEAFFFCIIWVIDYIIADNNQKKYEELCYKNDDKYSCAMEKDIPPSTQAHESFLQDLKRSRMYIDRLGAQKRASRINSNNNLLNIVATLNLQPEMVKLITRIMQQESCYSFAFFEHNFLPITPIIKSNDPDTKILFCSLIGRTNIHFTIKFHGTYSHYVERKPLTEVPQEDKNCLARPVDIPTCLAPETVNQFHFLVKLCIPKTAISKDGSATAYDIQVIQGKYHIEGCQGEKAINWNFSHMNDSPSHTN